MEYRNIANKSVFLPYRTVPNLQCNIHITSLTFDVICIEHFRIPTFQDAALATRLAIVQTFPCFEDIGSPFFLGGVIYFWWLHGFFKLNDSHLNHSIPFILKDAVGFLNLTQRKTMRDEWSGVNLSCFNKAKDFFTIASIHATRFEG